MLLSWRFHHLAQWGMGNYHHQEEILEEPFYLPFFISHLSVASQAETFEQAVGFSSPRGAGVRWIAVWHPRFLLRNPGRGGTGIQLVFLLRKWWRMQLLRSFFFWTNLIQNTTGSWCERSDSWSYPWGFFTYLLGNKISSWITICSDFLASQHASCFHLSWEFPRSAEGLPAQVPFIVYFASEVIPRLFSSPSSLNILTSGIYRMGVSSGDHQEAGVTDRLFLRCRARKNSCKTSKPSSVRICHLW